MENREKKKFNKPLIIIGLMLIFMVIIIIAMYYMKGKTTTSGEWEGLQAIRTLTCESEGISYPIFKYDYSNNKTMKVSATFSDNELAGISLIYRLSYPNSDMVERSDSENEAAMNFSFGDDRLEAFAFNANYARLGNVLQMTLYTEAKRLNSNTLKYFMLEELADEEKYTQESVMKAYNHRGFNCVYKKI